MNPILTVLSMSTCAGGLLSVPPGC
uniref:Uncharacterized protein n=1 Tax=Timema shepardi TaxID=629360 RepID=A0A7R9BDZ0_TIMSH|nr:unnamed protein product [Timema shepardi]